MSKELLLHCCCGPCGMYPIRSLLDKDIVPDLYWYNPNIHPRFEYDRRYENLEIVAKHYNLELFATEAFMQDSWEQEVYKDNYDSRCHMCYDLRIDQIARFAAENNYDAFSTTLLVSPYQNHELMIDISKDKAIKYGVRFYYEDFRVGYRQGQNMARELGIYRQKYCGCIKSLETSDFREKILKSFETN